MIIAWLARRRLRKDEAAAYNTERINNEWADRRERLDFMRAAMACRYCPIVKGLCVTDRCMFYYDGEIKQRTSFHAECGAHTWQEVCYPRCRLCKE